MIDRFSGGAGHEVPATVMILMTMMRVNNNLVHDRFLVGGHVVLLLRMTLFLCA